MGERRSGFHGRRVLMTGGTGFLGTHLAEALHRLGADLHVLTTRSAPPTSWSLDLRDAVHLHEADLSHGGDVAEAVRIAQPETVFHLGAFTDVGRSWSATAECIRVNVEGTAHLLAALGRDGYQRLVHVSTTDVYGDNQVPTPESATPQPSSPYAVSKRAAEMLCQLDADHDGRPIVQLRVCNAYGPGQPPDRVIPEIITRALRGDDVEMTAGTQTREFSHVGDLVDGFLAAATVDGIDGTILNLGGGEETSIAQLATTVLELMGDPVQVHLGAIPGRPGQVHRMCADSTKARELLGWSPRPLRAGLAETIEWYRRQLSS